MCGHAQFLQGLTISILMMADVRAMVSKFLYISTVGWSYQNNSTITVAMVEGKKSRVNLTGSQSQNEFCELVTNEGAC